MNVRCNEHRPNTVALDRSSMARNSRNEHVVDLERGHRSISSLTPTTMIATATVTAPGPGSLSRKFGLQPFTLNSAVSPLLRKPTAPFDRTERKRAHTSARYYSECVLKGIEPVVADSAADDVQEKYNKWWVKSVAHKETELSEPGMPKELDHPQTQARSTFETYSHQQQHGEHVEKWRRTGTSSSGHQDDDASRSAAVVSVATSRHSSARGSRKEDAEPLELEPVPVLIRNISTISPTTPSQVNAVKSRLIEELRSSGGSVHTPRFLECLEFLEAYYRSKSWDGRGSKNLVGLSDDKYSGTWLTLSKPTYNECKGRNEKGEYMYTMGRMSFDMFKPTNLECSIQAVFNTVRPIDSKKPDRPLHGPKRLMKEIQKGQVKLQTYDITVAFTIEPGQTRRGEKKDVSEGEYVVPRQIRGILHNQGYLVPDPDVPNRLSIWFSGGSLEVQDEPRDLEEWRTIFDKASAPNRDLREYANILAAKVLLGAHLPETIDEDGSMHFVLKRPIGGHGSAYCDIVFMDEDLRIQRGHHGSVYVCKRIPQPNNIV